MAKPVVGIQMYSLRDQTEIDFLGTLEKVSKIGYTAVEFAGFFKTPAIELKSKLKELGLTAPSVHVPLNFSDSKHMESDFAGQIEYAKELGVSYIITPWAPLPEQPSKDNVKYLIDVFTKCAQQVRAAGMQYGYHNHEFEFKLVEKQPIIDQLLSGIPTELMMMEFDLGWVHIAGYKPADYLKKYKSRVPLVHLKDFSKGLRDAEIGQGEVGYSQLLSELEPAGVAYMFVEQEQFASSSLESAANNYKFLKEHGFA
ncbi:sugar phosphate isomerase/epimerase [Paenibacillus sp. LHD-38]|uniref:sugar phosphate isomerase/epimerase family protein n=1 Tax=Paenibacillus sp. LHD-38 TaxID=3072143 RepID=UPI00280DF1DF|nr:sugar phosphate isomerase/epimerase [Paenibacillus sp. LHD-38]MDQ8735051.1 sugar phosphate isomerase/epimerase [Paenibacillus sp. LHD-38]